MSNVNGIKLVKVSPEIANAVRTNRRAFSVNYQFIFETFLNGSEDVAEVNSPGHKDHKTLRTSVGKAISYLGLEQNVYARMYAGKVYLVRK